MAYLLDTHTFIWYITGNPKLSDAATSAVERHDTSRFLSVVSIWEIGIAHSLERIVFDLPFEETMEIGLRENAIDLLNLELRHVSKLLSLPFHHRDPFDRMLAAQCLASSLQLISVDRAFDQYDVPRVW